MNTAIAVTAIILRQRDDVGRQAPLVGIILRGMSLRRAMLAEYATGPSFRYRQRTTNLLDRLSAARVAKPIVCGRRLTAPMSHH